MDRSQLQPFLKLERKNTDKSLHNERDKTNKSLTDARLQTEHITDRVIHAERVLTDEETSSSRLFADEHRGCLRSESAAKANAAHDAAQLHAERQTADEAIERERAHVDTALEHERQAKSAIITRFFQQERDQTDENLWVERYRTDSEVQQTNSLLSIEVADHLKTKTSLTTRDEFLAIVSHDLRNPISAVSACADILLDGAYPATLDPQTRAWVELMQLSANSSLRLIKDLLDMERVAEGKLELKLARHDLDAIIRESISSHALMATAKSVLLHAIPAPTHADIFCDRDRISQVLANLICNAIKFTPENGTITVSSSIEGEQIQVSIQDCGPGIPDEYREQIFERFVQLGSKDWRGLGLGLHISKMLIEAHRGRLWVQGGERQGSAFCFTLPNHHEVTKFETAP